jgi:hypothetical protein
MPDDGQTGGEAKEKKEAEQWLFRTKRLPWRNVMIAVLLVAAPLVVWATRPAEALSPTPMLDAQGVLLTALVFLLTISSGRHRESVDAAVERLRAREVGLIRAAGSHQMPGSWRERARAVAKQHRLVAAAIQGRGWFPTYRLRLLQARRTLLSDRGEHYGRQLSGSADDKSSAELATTEQRLAAVGRALDQRVDAGYEDGDVSGLVEQIDYEINSANRPLRMARLQVATMASLTWIGALYAHWSLFGQLTTEKVVAVVLVSAAWAYTETVAGWVDRMSKQAVRQILAMPLTSLASAEHLLPTDTFVGYCEDTWGTDEGQRKHLVSIWEYLVLPLLEDVEVEYPRLPWAHGLRGLYYLCLARWDCHRLATLRSSVTEAEAELRRRDQAERVAQADKPAQEQQVATDAEFHAMLDRMIARRAADEMDELRAVEPLARWEAEQAAAHLRIATEGDDDPVALVGLVTVEELQRFAGSSPGPDGSVSEHVDKRNNGAALAKALHRFSSTVPGEGMMVAYDAGGFLKLASWVLPDASDAAEPLRHEIDRLNRRLMFAVVKKLDFWLVPRAD